MTQANRETTPKQIALAAHIRTDWEAKRGFGNHLSAEQYAENQEVPFRDEIFTLEGVLSTILEEWFELYEAVLQPEPVEAEFFEVADIGAYALGFYVEQMRAQNESGVTYSEKEAEAATQLITQAILAGEVKEFPQVERGQEEKAVILADMRHIAVELLKTYVGLVGAETTEDEIIRLVEAAHHFVEGAVTERGKLSEEDQSHLKFFVMTPLIKDSPDGPRGKTAVHPDASQDLVLQGFKALEDFVYKHYGIEYFWLHVGFMYTPSGKNGQNYPHPIPEGYSSYAEYKREVRAKFPGRVIPQDFDPYIDTPESYMQRWHEEHPGEEFVVKSKILDLVGIEEQLR